MKCEVHIDCSDGLTFKRPSLVKVQFADECDLSKVISKFMRTGELPNLAVKKPLNIDATNLPEDFQSLQDMKVNLSNSFEAEPLAIKEACQHNLEIYAEFKCLDGSSQVDFLKARGFSKDAICSLLNNPDLFEQPGTQPSTQPATQPSTQPATQPSTQPATQPAG